MTPANYKKSIESTIRKCWKKLWSKNKEYARHADALHNFHSAAMMEDTLDVKALRGMMTKHTVSVYDMVDDEEEGIHHSYSLWEEKIIDMVNYLLILMAMIDDRKNHGYYDDKDQFNNG